MTEMTVLAELGERLDPPTRTPRPTCAAGC